MRIRKGRLRLSPNEEALILKEETEKRRKLRLQQVREQSKENAAKIRHAVKQEKHKQLMRLATDIKDQLEAEKAERVRHLEQQYDNSLRNIGVGHKSASQQPDWAEEKTLVQQEENLRAEARGRAAVERQKQETAQRNFEAQKHVIARQEALAIEKARASQVASMPAPPPDPVANVIVPKPKPVKVTDMNTFSMSHYHLQNEHAVDRAEPDEQQTNAREAAEMEQERIHERAMELKRLRQDQLERARLRHNAALEKELLKHDYDNILHDLSDLQRADRERRLKIVHNIPKQVFEPPHIRMEDREEKQRNLEEEFEDMYMAGSRRLGDMSMVLEPRPFTPSQEDSLDVTGNDVTGTPVREPTLPGMPSVLQDMTNVPKQRKQPEKVLRNLMDRIKSQREEWVNTHSLGEVGESPGYPTLSQGIETQSPAVNGGDSFRPLVPEESPAAHSAEKQARVHSPVAMGTGGGRKVAPARGDQPRERITAMPPDEFSEKLRATNERQQTNVQFQPEATQTATMPSQLQQIEYAEIFKQQEIILEQKRQLELQLQKLTYEQQRLQLANKAGSQQPPASYAVPAGSVAMPMPVPGSVAMPMLAPGSFAMPMPATGSVAMSAPSSQPLMPSAPSSEPQPSHPYVQTSQSWQGSQPIGFESLQNGHPPVSGYFPMTSMPQPHSFLPQTSQFQGQFLGQHGVAMQSGLPGAHQNLNGSLSSSGMSQKPMNSIPPTHTTGSAPITTSQGQGVNGYQGQGQIRSAYQPPSAVLTTDQLATSSSQIYPISAQNGYHQGATVSMTTSSFAPVSMATSFQGHPAVSPGHIPPSSLTSAGMSEQMRKVKEYQEYLLARHEQSKKVLDETKAEIKRRRDNLLQRYPNLDLTRLEGLGAKYLENGDVPQASGAQTRVPSAQDQVGPVPAPRSSGQGQTSVASLLASLAAHPYYAATLSQPDHDSSARSSAQTTATVGAVQMKGSIPATLDLNSETNLRKNKFESIRKSLPFDGDESFQNDSFPVRVYDAYAQKNLDGTSTTDFTECDTSTSTEKGSPALRPPPKPAPRNTDHSRKRSHDNTEQFSTTPEESDMDTSTSFVSDREKDVSMLRQEELRKQLEDIQRQKEEIIRRHQQGQQSLRSKEDDLKAKLASLAPEELARQLRDTAKQQQLQDMYPTNLRQPFNLSTIMEVETPSSSARPSDGHSSDPNDLSQYSLQSQKSKRSLDYSQSKSSERIPEEPDMENVQTQMEALKKGKSETVADYSGRNIENVLERAKRFESEVLEKLRKQTNAVLFDNQFDDSLEFSVSKKETSNQSLSTGTLTSNQSLSTGTLTDDSLSTGPLDETGQSRQMETKSANGSFQNSKSWATELSQFKIPASNQAELPFKVMPSKVSQASTDNPDTMFTTNRFKIYSAINQSGSGASLSESSLMDESGSMNANDMMVHLKTLQDQIRRSEEERVMLARKLVEEQKTSQDQGKSLSQYSAESSHEVSRPFMNGSSKNDGNKSDLSQYSLTDKSADVSFSGNYQSESKKDRFESPIQSGTSCQEKELPVRRSPIGHTATVAPQVSTKQKGNQDMSGTEYSFMMSESKQQRSTSTPGDDRKKSAMNGTNRSELPSEITVGDKTDGFSINRKSDNFGRDSPTGSRSFHMIGEESSTNRRSFETMSPERHDNSTNGELSQHSLSAEENIKEIKKEFDRLDMASQKIKTYAVSKDGELISENSDSDKSQSVEKMQESDLTNYTLSTQDSTDRFTKSKDPKSKLSVYSLPESSVESRLSQVSDFSNKSSWKSDSLGSNPKSSSFTNVTSESSLDATGLSTLSQYTLGDSKAQTQRSVGDDENYMHEKFASLDNLISESKNLIARHKQIIDKSKNLEEIKPKLPSSPPPPLPKQPAPWESLGKPLPSRGSGSKQSSSQKKETFPPKEDSKLEKKTSSLPTKFDLHGPKPFYKSAKSAEESSRSLSMDTSQTGSFSTQNTGKDQSSNVDVNSLEYLVENSAGITDETIPDLTTMTLGSELSITEAFNKTEDLNESSDSLMSFEKHEMSDAESSHNFDDDGSRVDSRADNLHQIIEARKHNFMVQSERRAAAAKERALGQHVSKDNDHQVFRAVPVSIVAEPTLSMAVSSSRADRSKASTSPKGGKPDADRKSTFESKEKDLKLTTSTASVPSKSLNRALQPRGSESPRPKDSGTDPSESSTRSRDHGKFGFGSSRLSPTSPSPNSSSDERAHHGKLFGEIQQFGGSAGLAARQSPSPSPSPPTQRKTPPKVMPKPVRKNTEEAQPVSKPVSQPSAGGSGLSKTLSSWKKSRAVSAPPVSRLLESNQSHEALKNSIKVLPEEAPVPLTEEERRKRAEDELYEKNIRAYNPRLFRLQHKLDATDDQDTSNNFATSPSEKTRDSKKETDADRDIRMSQFSSQNKRLMALI